MSDRVRQGGCRCGRVRFAATGEPLLTSAWHCRGCQRMTASAFTLTDNYPRAAFEVREGEVVVGGLHGPSRHYFCDHCKSWLFTHPEGLDEIVNVRSTMFDTPGIEPPFVEVFVGERLPFVEIRAAHSYVALPATEEWPGLAKEFAAHRAAAMEETKT